MVVLLLFKVVLKHRSELIIYILYKPVAEINSTTV